jgi:mannitol-specific phosphotransferase system IIBC component
MLVSITEVIVSVILSVRTGTILFKTSGNKQQQTIDNQEEKITVQTNKLAEQSDKIYKT